jgi:hypothetical protein
MIKWFYTFALTEIRLAPSEWRCSRTLYTFHASICQPNKKGQSNNLTERVAYATFLDPRPAKSAPLFFRVGF